MMAYDDSFLTAILVLAIQLHAAHDKTHNTDLETTHTLVSKAGPKKAADSHAMVAPMRMLKTPTTVMASAQAV